jgi:hypothetical protein
MNTACRAQAVTDERYQSGASSISGRAVCGRLRWPHHWGENPAPNRLRCEIDPKELSPTERETDAMRNAFSSKPLARDQLMEALSNSDRSPSGHLEHCDVARAPLAIERSTNDNAQLALSGPTAPVTGDGKLDVTRVKSDNLGRLGDIPPELRDMIYARVPPNEAPEIGSPCLPFQLRRISHSIYKDLHRLKEPCAHTKFTLTCNDKSIENDPHAWIRTILATTPSTDLPSHDLTKLGKTLNIAVAHRDGGLPTLRYQMWSTGFDNFSLYVSAANHARQCKHRDVLQDSFELAAKIVLATHDILFRHVAISTPPTIDTSDCRRLELHLQRFAIPVKEQGEMVPILFCSDTSYVEELGARDITITCPVRICVSRRDSLRVFGVAGVGKWDESDTWAHDLLYPWNKSKMIRKLYC